MATVLVVLMVVSTGGLSPPCAAAAKEEKPVVVLPPAAAPGEAPFAEAAAFVRSCCETALPAERDASSFCYDELLPYADSFGGNQVKVTEVAATILSNNLSAYLDELRKVQDGAGKGDQNLMACVDGFYRCHQREHHQGGAGQPRPSCRRRRWQAQQGGSGECAEVDQRGGQTLRRRERGWVRLRDRLPVHL
ncbi:hypothetical protein EE612_042812 [Oryza sativa]|nr:hypothetical protein EE612_042812 [Oryza sativa]